MSPRRTARLRHYVGQSPVLQIAMFIAIMIVVLLVAEYTGIFGA